MVTFWPGSKKYPSGAKIIYLYNTKDYDLIVLNKDGTTSSPIQVKTTSQKSGWVLSKKHETPIKDLIFCFVYMDLNSSYNEIFIVVINMILYDIIIICRYNIIFSII